MEAKIFIGNILKSTTRDELAALFAQAGTVISAEMVKDGINGVPKRYAFVTMSTQSEADKAVSMFDMHLFQGHTLRVSHAISSVQRDVNTSSAVKS